MIAGAPSVLYDAVAVLPSEKAMADLVKESTARDFVADAFAHCKFIGFSPSAALLFEKAGIAADLDEGCMRLASAGDPRVFLKACRTLRHWARELQVDLAAK
jgi:catalase